MMDFPPQKETGGKHDTQGGSQTLKRVHVTHQKEMGTNMISDYVEGPSGLFYLFPKEVDSDWTVKSKEVKT